MPKKNKIYSVRVHEKEFALIKKNSALFRRLLEQKKKREKWYARLAVNAPARRRQERRYRENKEKQFAAIGDLNHIISQRRPLKLGIELKPVFEEYNYGSYSEVENALERSRCPRDENNNLIWHAESPRMPCFSGRAGRLLRRLNIVCVNDFRRVAPYELMALPGLGVVTIKKLIDGLKQFDITLGDLAPQTKLDTLKTKKNVCQQKQKTQ